MTIKLNPNDAQAYNNRGAAYYNQGKLELAIRDYNKTIKLDPDFADAYYNRGEVQLYLQEWKKAKDDLRTTQDMGINIIDAFHNDHKNIEDFEERNDFKLPANIAAMLAKQ